MRRHLIPFITPDAPATDLECSDDDDDDDDDMRAPSADLDRRPLAGDGDLVRRALANDSNLVRRPLAHADDRALVRRPSLAHADDSDLVRRPPSDTDAAPLKKRKNILRKQRFAPEDEHPEDISLVMRLIGFGGCRIRYI